MNGWDNKIDAAYVNFLKHSGEITYPISGLCGPIPSSCITETTYDYEIGLNDFNGNSTNISKLGSKITSCNRDMFVMWFDGGTRNTSYNMFSNLNASIFEVKNVDDCEKVVTTKNGNIFPVITGNTQQNFEHNQYTDNGYPLILDSYGNPKRSGGMPYNGHKISCLPFSSSTYIPSEFNCYNNDIVELYFPHRTDNRRIKNIGASAFTSCNNLTAVTFGSVSGIDEYAFANCVNLSEVDWGYKPCNKNTDIKNIGASAFTNCYNLKTVQLGDGSIIGNGAFQNCSGLLSVKLDNWYSIGASAFTNCTSLSAVTIESVNSVGGIYQYAFANCASLKTINLPSGLSSIYTGVCESCTSLTSITIPNSVTRIDNNAFQNCSSLTSCTIGNGVRNIGSRAFADCRYLSDITCYAVNPPESGSSMFDGVSSRGTLHVPRASEHNYDNWEYIFPQGTTPQDKWVISYDLT